MELSFKLNGLFGGAIAVDVPSLWIDASTFRQVPDNQEVFVAEDASDASLVVEMLEPPEGIPDDEIADYLFRDLVEANDSMDCSVVKITQLTSAKVPCLKSLDGITAYCLEGRMTVSKFKEGPASACNEVAVSLGVIRLPAPIDTDLMVTVNAPVQIAPDSGSAAVAGGASRPELATAVLHRALASLDIIDFSLFAGE